MNIHGGRGGGALAADGWRAHPDASESGAEQQPDVRRARETANGQAAPAGRGRHTPALNGSGGGGAGRPPGPGPGRGGRPGAHIIRQ